MAHTGLVFNRLLAPFSTREHGIFVLQCVVVQNIPDLFFAHTMCQTEN